MHWSGVSWGHLISQARNIWDFGAQGSAAEGKELRDSLQRNGEIKLLFRKGSSHLGHYHLPRVTRFQAFSSHSPGTPEQSNVFLEVIQFNHQFLRWRNYGREHLHPLKIYGSLPPKFPSMLCSYKRIIWMTLINEPNVSGPEPIQVRDNTSPAFQIIHSGQHEDQREDILLTIIRTRKQTSRFMLLKLGILCHWSLG